MTKMFSTDAFSYFEFILKEVEYRLPSICVDLEVHNRGFTASLPNVWIELSSIEKFLGESKDLSFIDTFQHAFTSMSPEEVIINANKVSPSICQIRYTFNKTYYSSDLNPVLESIQQKGSFELEVYKIEESRKALLEISDLFH
ncbi:hypothetical protein [Metabacillus sp. SLBN-84]